MYTLFNMLLHACRTKTQLIFSKDFPEHQVIGKNCADKKKRQVLLQSNVLNPPWRFSLYASYSWGKKKKNKQPSFWKSRISALYRETNVLKTNRFIRLKIFYRCWYTLHSPWCGLSWTRFRKTVVF